MADIVELKKSTGGYMSVDAAAVVEHNQQVIDNLRRAFQQAAAAPRERLQEPAPAAVAGK
jgi:hypothetical protein